MNNGQIRDLCVGLLYAETEDEVITLLQKAGYWEDPAVWRHYGDVENNWGQVAISRASPRQRWWRK